MAKYKIIPSSRTIVQSPISIGHKAEKGVEAIEFDVTAWVETYGSGTLTVIMRRWGDAIPYPIALEIDENNKAVWTLSDIDTAKAGMAYAQLSYIVGDEVVKKSDIYTLRVMNSLTGEGETPEAYESWLEHLTHFAAEAMAEVLDIEGIVTDKTLTVDGGIADAKATGEALAEKVDAADYNELSARVGANTIALAEKADRSTTYTKAQVDQMISDVEVETDTTLEVAGAAADAAETGRQIGLIKADLGYLLTDVNAPSIWELGGISSSTGEGSGSTTRLRTINYIGKVKVVPSIGYKYIVCAYNDGAYVGMWNGTSFVKSATWITDMTDLAGLDGYDSYDYKLVFANTSDGAITVEDSAYIALLLSTDDTLTEGGKSADAKATGDALGALEDQFSEEIDKIKAEVESINESFAVETGQDMVNGGINSSNGDITTSSTRLVSSDFLYSGNVSCDSGYKYIIAAYNDNTYVGMWNGTSLVKSATWFNTDTDLSDIGHYSYKFVLAKSDDSLIETSESEHLKLAVITDSSLKLGGKAADAYAVGNMFTATLTQRGSLTNADDLDDIVDIGVYACSINSLPANVPAIFGGTLLVYGDATIVQEYYFRAGTIIKYRIRLKTSAGWSQWSTGAENAYLMSTSDLNDVTTTGAYGYQKVSIPAHAPDASNGATMYVFEVIRHPTGSSVVQILRTVNAVYTRMKTFSEQWTDWKRLLSTDDLYKMSELPVLELTGDITNMTKDVSVTLDYALFDISGTCTCKWQGSSSVRYAKKNYTVKLDTAMNAMSNFVTYINNRRAANGNVSRLPANASWGNQTKYNFKANYIDPSMMRNIVCARLWSQIVKSRVDNSDITDGRATAPAYGAIDGFPCEIKINGESVGLYTMNIPKDKWMFNMGEGAAEYVVSGEDNGSNACRWKATALVDGTDYSVEYAPDNVQDSTIATSLNTAIQEAINAGADWETALAPYLDVDSVFDYFIFTCCINNHDALARNILYGTYDGVKWFMSAYDMDTTFGVDPYGTLWFDVVNDRNQFAQAASMHRLAYLMYTHSKAKLKARYQALRSTVLSGANVFKELSNFAVLIPERDYDVDREIWQSMPGTATANIPMYMEYYRMHCAYLDSEINAM